uniref:Uncharacterized protein n=1 Tax=Setaria italica TaxID=4555 RepID=K4AN05_SETIT
MPPRPPPLLSPSSPSADFHSSVPVPQRRFPVASSWAGTTALCFLESQSSASSSSKRRMRTCDSSTPRSSASCSTRRALPARYAGFSWRPEGIGCQFNPDGTWCLL